MKRTREEYGGFLPLELKDVKEYHNYANQRRFNCAKAALDSILSKIECEEIYLPYYLCPNVCAEVERHFKEITYYHIDEELMPIGLIDKEQTCIYLVDYFGIMNQKINCWVQNIKHAIVIVDLCHSFFAQPIWADNVYNIYSCKKFFGVPDGAYLIGNKVEYEEECFSIASQNAQYLIDCVEQGTNYCYLQKKEVDKIIGSHYDNMSILAHKILKGIDYEYVKKRRKDNFQTYEKAFSNINKIKCEEDSIPYMYPLHIGKNIKAELVKKKIYVPTLWGQMLDEKYKGTLEYELSEQTIFLPLDQRYDVDDIRYIIQIVKEIME